MASKGKILKKIKEHKGNKIMDEELKDFSEEEILEEIDEASEEEAAKEQETDADAVKAEGEENAEAEADEEAEAKEEKDPKQARIEELEDMVKRQLAEFDNFRKRTDKEKDTMFEAGARSVIEKLLPVVDNFERGIASLSEEELKAHRSARQRVQPRPSQCGNAVRERRVRKRNHCTGITERLYLSRQRHPSQHGGSRILAGEIR